MKRIFLILIIFFICVTVVYAQQNPFITTGDPVDTEAQPPLDDANKETVDVKSDAVFNSAFMQWIRSSQKVFHAKISGYISDYQTGGGRSSLITFLVFSFLYGLLHALGPGHRKIFLFSYFVSQPSRWRIGMLAGFMTAVLHALSAVVFISGLYFITSKALLTRFNNISPILEKISYGAIAAIGLYLLIHHIAGHFRNNRHSDNKNGRKPDTLLFILASGVIPCPGAATIMIFSLAVGAPVVGVYAVAAMSLGMAVLLSLIPPAAILINNRLEPLISRWNPDTGDRIHTGISVAGAAALILLGLVFII